MGRWLLHFSTFVSEIYLKHPKTEMKGLIQHVFNRLQKDSFGELLVLRDLIAKMAGIKYEISTVSVEDVESRGGGERLRAAVENPWPVDFIFESAKAEDLGKGGGRLSFRNISAHPQSESVG